MKGLRPSWAKWGFACGLVPLCLVLYLFNLGGWLMHDDEGTDFYEVWQLSEGQQPGTDFLAEQQPLYLLSGRLIMTNSSNPAYALRLFSVLQVFLGALILTITTNKVFGKNNAILSFGILLGCGMLYEQARLFRPDPMMLAWELGGLAAVLWAVDQEKRWLWVVAGACFGTAVLWKLFGVFPVLGLAIFFLYRLVREPQKWREIVSTGIIFAVPFLIVAGGISLLLYNKLGFYYQEAFVYHLEANQNNGFGHQLLIVLGGYLLFLISNAIFIFILPLRFLNRKQPRKSGLPTTILVTQLLTPIFFLLITRPIHLRYYLFLLPTLTLLLAKEGATLIKTLSKEAPQAKPLKPLLLLLIIISGWLITQPNIPDLLQRQETDTLALAELVAQSTNPADIVVSDYASINFFAKRASIYEASIIAGAQIDSGSITGKLLIDRMEQTDAKMVLVHVAGGEPTPHQMVNLADYDQFREYLITNFQLLTIFDRAGQQIEVYERK